jgi:hypothetical protein
MLGALMMVAALSTPSCTSAYGRIECGWNCLARYGELECAQWPGGSCLAAYGQVECGPPEPAGGYGVSDPDIRFPMAQCVAHRGQIECGWDCKTRFDTVKCAAWPGGACVQHRDTVVCGPEAPPRWWALFRRGERISRAQCISKHDQVACGWNCESRYGQVACMDTPR